jgi:threonine/homoserine/homoserine lactone efflux protein
MPYIFAVGSIFFLFLGYKIIRTKIDIENLEDKTHLTEKIQRRDKGAFYTGFMINFLNPTLFIGVITSSFFVISLISSLGFNTGGLSGKMDQNVKEINRMEGINIENPQTFSLEKYNNIGGGKSKDHKADQTVYPKYFHLVISICYALFLSLGSIIWFLLLAFLIVRFRSRINLKTVSVFIKCLGGILCLFGLYFGYQVFGMVM